MLTPWLMILLNYIFERSGAPPFSMMPPLAAIAIAYALGEGCGRLACISFGCCYGKPLAGLPPLLRWLLSPFSSTSYDGATKKIAYADGLLKSKVVAVQAITTVLYTLAGICAMIAFLRGRSHFAYLLCVGVTQIWRFLTEFLRADYRGLGRISAYQVMALIAVAYAFGISFLAPVETFPADILKGLRPVWNPGIILLCQFLWIGIFLYMGRSQVTASRISFHVRKDRI